MPSLDRVKTLFGMSKYGLQWEGLSGENGAITSAKDFFLLENMNFFYPFSFSIPFEASATWLTKVSTYILYGHKHVTTR